MKFMLPLIQKKPIFVDKRIDKVSVIYRSMLILSAIFLSLIAHAETPEEKGRAIAELSDRSDRGFTDSFVVLNMILRNASGQTSERNLTIKTLEVPDETQGDKSLIYFESPADIRGTALLSHAKILDADDQWLYLPALKRVKRISSVNKSGPFVGSEFAFEDFTAQELNKYRYKYLRTEACGSLTCDVLEQIPEYEHSGYSKQVAWIDQQDSQTRKLEFYDRKNSKFKTLTFEGYRQYKNKYWRAEKLLMQNHQTGKSTDLIFSDYQFKTGLKKSDFVKSALERLR